MWTCPLCGANLDSGEKCDCMEEKRKKEVLRRPKLTGLNNTKHIVPQKLINSQLK